jgi:ABC-type antimicrobial peptide transport system permease subunit
MLLLSLFGVLGLVIACVGIYGVMAYAVSQRTQKIGIRMALGAVPSAILMSVLGRASLYMIFGLGSGLISAWGLAEFVRGFLFEIQPHEPMVYATALVLIAMTGLTAALLPAQRAAGVDPLVALRME